MHHRPPQQWPYGYAAASPDGGGYFYPVPFYQNVYPHFPPNIQYPQNVFQSPRVSRQQNTSTENAGLPAKRPSPKPSVKLETVEKEATKAHRDLVGAGMSVSAWKVSQNALAALKVDSWSSLGYQLQDVPTLKRLLVAEGKVNALIYCIVCARRIVSMYELEVALCQHMDVRQFGELGLGPFLHHPLIKHYFSVPAETTDVFKITSEEIILSLKEFISKSKKVISAEKFLMFLAEQKSVPVKEMLGVRIHNIEFYAYHIREAKKAEYTLLQEKLNRYSAWSDDIEVIGKMHTTKAQGIAFEKQFLDKRFNSISHRVRTFSSKHIHFVSSDDGDDVYDVEDDRESEAYFNEHRTISPAKGCGQLMSSCPYPSNSEEMMRLGLKPVESYKPSSAIDHITNKENMKSFKRKRKFENENSASSSCKFLRCEEVIDLDTEDEVCDHTLSNDDIEKFVATWNVACQKHSIAKVLDMMLSFYVLKRGQRKKIKKLMSSYPAIGWLNVAVMSIKRGMFESIYDSFQALNEKELMGADSVCFGEMIEVRPPVEVSDPTISIDYCFSKGKG